MITRGETPKDRKIVEGQKHLAQLKHAFQHQQDCKIERAIDITTNIGIPRCLINPFDISVRKGHPACLRTIFGRFIVKSSLS
jgi:hypothetical protein